MIMKEKRNKIFRGCHCTNSGCVLFITLSVFVFFIEKMDNVVLQTVIFILDSRKRDEDTTSRIAANP